MNEIEAAAFGKAVGDATRQRILRYCCCEQRSVGEIAKHAKITQPTASHHLAILERAELVSRVQEGKAAFYRVRQETMVSCCGQLLLCLAPDAKGTKALNRCC